MPTGLEVLRNNVLRFIKAEETALEKCTKGCTEVCKDCLHHHWNAIKSSEVSQFPNQDDVASA